MDENSITRREFDQLLKLVRDLSSTAAETQKSVIRMEEQLKFLDVRRITVLEKAVEEIEQREIEELRGEQRSIKRAVFGGVVSIILGWLADIFFLRGGNP